MPDTDDALQKVLQALASPVRREILWMVADAERTAGEIAAAVHVTAPTVSQHLQVLRGAGLLTMRVDGSFRRYRCRRDALASLPTELLARTHRWTPVTGRSDGVAGRARHAVSVTVEVDCPRSRVFTGFTDPLLYSRWLGAPVHIDDGRFAATLGWGTQVRGRYELVAAPDLLVMRWDFGDDVPVPGAEHRGYARFTDTDRGGCLISIDQLVDTAEQAAFMERAWGFVLGRLAANIDVLHPTDDEDRDP